MCMVAYIASRSPLPLIPWQQDAPVFNVTELTEHEHSVLRHLALPHVRQAGSHTRCGPTGELLFHICAGCAGKATESLFTRDLVDWLNGFTHRPFQRH